MLTYFRRCSQCPTVLRPGPHDFGPVWVAGPTPYGSHTCHSIPVISRYRKTLDSIPFGVSWPPRESSDGLFASQISNIAALISRNDYPTEPTQPSLDPFAAWQKVKAATRYPTRTVFLARLLRVSVSW